VTFDVTQGLSAAGVGVFMADGGCLLASTTCLSTGRSAPSRSIWVPASHRLPSARPWSACLRLAAVYIESPEEVDACGWPETGGPTAQEMHRFLIHLPSEWRAVCIGARFSEWAQGTSQRCRGWAHFASGLGAGTGTVCLLPPSLPASSLASPCTQKASLWVTFICARSLLQAGSP
jgi:hypothetical protein